MITPELLEHQYHWQRGTDTLSNYLGFNATLARGSFHDHMARIRGEEREHLINDQAVRDFSVGTMDENKLSMLLENIQE